MPDYLLELKQREEAGLLRKLTVHQGGIDFFSNDYLGLAKSKELHQAIADEYQSLQLSNGSTGSRLLSGNSDLAEEIEKEIASFHKVESALIFGSGYAANVGLISSLGKRSLTLISDEYIHASMIDGIRLSHANRIRFSHNDLVDLEKKLQEITTDKIVLIESIYSMDGDVAPISEIVTLCKKHKAELIVDEAHTIGIAGSNGLGIVHSLGLQNEVLATIVTFGKALGVHGAAVLGAPWLKQYLINFSRSFIYSTAPSPHQLVSIRQAYRAMQKAEEARATLKSNIDYFTIGRNASNKNWIESSTAIQSLIVPGNEEVISLSSMLKANNFNILPIRSPTVPEGLERLRISLHSFNTKEQIDKLFELINNG